MIYKTLTLSSVLLLCLTISTVASAAKVDNTVLYKKGKAYCNKSLHLNYSPPKDMLFCTHKPKKNYVHVDGKGKPNCSLTYKLVYTSNASKIFKMKPSCIKRELKS